MRDDTGGFEAQFGRCGSVAAEGGETAPRIDSHCRDVAVCGRRRRLPADDPERLGELFAELTPRMLAVALRYTRDPDAARDVVQNAFEKVVRHGASFRGQSRVSTWIHRIVANEALMWLRSEDRRRSHQEGEPACAAALVDPSRGPEQIADKRRREALLRKLVDRLPHEERDVVLHCSLGGDSYAEYGARTGAHPSAIKSRAFRARRHLAEAAGEIAIL